MKLKFLLFALLFSIYYSNAQVDCATALGSLPSIAFYGNSTTLTTDAQGMLASVAGRLRNNPNCRITVVGYCVNQKDQTRGVARVDAVVIYLVEKEGISRDRITTLYGQQGGDCGTVDLRAEGDSPSLPFISINDTTVPEDAGTASLTISLDKPALTPVIVAYETQDGTAVSTGKNPDYRSTKGTVTFTGNITSIPISIAIRSDKLTSEGSEDFYVNLSLNKRTPIAASFADNQGVVTITDAAAGILNDELTWRKDNEDHNLITLSVRAIPNPFPKFFSLQLQSPLAAPVSIRVMDVWGRLVESKLNLPVNHTIQLGLNYKPGIYYTEVMQKNEKVVLKLLKN